MRSKHSTEPIRVLHVLTGMNRGGAETMVMNLYRVIDRNRIQFDFAVSVKNECSYDKEIIKMGGKIIHYPRYKIINHFTYKKWWNNFLKNNPQYKIVHGHIGSTAAIYLNIANKHGRFTIAHSHSAGSSMTLKGILYRIYSFRTRYIANYFLACGDAAMKKRYGRKIAKNKEKSSILPNGIDLSKYKCDKAEKKKIKSSLGVDDTSFLVGTVGRISLEKNPFFIVDIVSEMRKIDSTFKFLWVGDGKLKDDVKKYIEKKNLSKKIVLLGIRDDVPNILKALDVFILPSKYEGLPVVGIEAQAAGIPFICSDRVSPEVKLTGCCAFLPIDSPSIWAKEILSQSNTKERKDTHAILHKAGYDINSTSAWLMDFYLKALNDKMKE